jgi:isoleucyl-tRNA synthetase
MSAVYLDILKDRLYTFRADSPLRRGSQTVLFDLVVAMAKLMAPVLSFTTEEIWRTLAAQPGGRLGMSSVHLTAFPEVQPQWHDVALAQRWERLLKYRAEVQSLLEGMRQGKEIGSSLEARIQILAKPEVYEFLKPYVADLTMLFIVSQVELVCDPTVASDLAIVRSKAKGSKCERCWNYRPAVGTFKDHPTLCDRCVEAVQ